MSDRIDLGGKPWHALPRELLRDKRLSPTAKGGLVTILSHDSGWVRSVIALLMRENRACGRDQARAIMKELVAAGYAELTQGNGAGGKFTSAYTVRAESRSAPSTSLSPPTVTPEPVQPETVTPTPAAPSAVVDTPAVNPLDVDPITPKAKAAPTGADVDNVRQIVVSDRWPYFLEKLAAQDDAWERMTIGACVRIAKATSDGDVTTALSFAAERAPILTGSAYGWLEATSRGLMEARQESA